MNFFFGGQAPGAPFTYPLGYQVPGEIANGTRSATERAHLTDVNLGDIPALSWGQLHSQSLLVIGMFGQLPDQSDKTDWRNASRYVLPSITVAFYSDF